MSPGRRLCAVISILVLGGATLTLVIGIGRSASRHAPPAPTWIALPEMPWARISQAQLDASMRLGVPVAMENEWGMRFVLIPAGTFSMGSPEREKGRRDDEVRHRVRISHAFYLQIDAVSWEEVNATAFLQSGPDCTWQSVRHGAKLSRRETDGLIAWLSARAGMEYRLPTEAEWEYACRAGTTTRYWWGDGAPSDPLAGPTNPWGLSNMTDGLFGEWCSDWYGPYPRGDAVDPQGPSRGTRYVTRNAWWTRGKPVRSAQRGATEPYGRFGPRCARVRLVVDLKEAPELGK